MRESRYVRLANTMWCFKKCENTVISTQKEQSHIHSMAAYGIIIGDDTPVRGKELQNVF